MVTVNPKVQAAAEMKGLEYVDVDKTFEMHTVFDEASQGVWVQTNVLLERLREFFHPTED